MSVSKIKATVFSQEQLASDVFSMWLEVGSIASEAKPGQFISVYSNDDSKLLPRPISICEIDRENGRENRAGCVAGGEGAFVGDRWGFDEGVERTGEAGPDVGRGWRASCCG